MYYNANVSLFALSVAVAVYLNVTYYESAKSLTVVYMLLLILSFVAEFVFYRHIVSYNISSRLLNTVYAHSATRRIIQDFSGNISERPGVLVKVKEPGVHRIGGERSEPSCMSQSQLGEPVEYTSFQHSAEYGAFQNNEIEGFPQRERSPALSSSQNYDPARVPAIVIFNQNMGYFNSKSPIIELIWLIYTGLTLVSVALCLGGLGTNQPIASIFAELVVISRTMSVIYREKIIQDMQN